MALTGDFATLNKLKKRLASLPGAPERAAQAIGPEVLAATNETFATETGPTGKKWKADKPGTYRRGTRSILNRSGAMRGSVGMVINGPKITITIGVDYYQYSHARRVIPTKRAPKKMSERARAAALRAMREILSQ